MKQITRTIFFAAILLILAAATLNTRSIAANNSPIKGNGFAVLELFTSEGCSSCPPADALLASIEKEAGNKPVYVLAYHVDYWNHLGWKDAFSDKAFTQRQYQYSHQLGAEVYTPQLVVNGQSECVGSDEGAVRHKLQNALNNGTGVSLNATAQVKAAKATLHYTIDGNFGKDKLVVAIVQKNAVSKVERGENEGRTLQHVQIVRQLFTFDVKGAQHDQSVDLPAGFNNQDWEIITMLQNTDSGSIDAAARISTQL